MRSRPLLAACFAVTLLVRPAVAAEVALVLGFDEGQGDTVKDASGKAREGKVTGAQWTEGVKGKALEFKGPDYSGPYKPPGSFVQIAGSEKANPVKTVEVSAAIYPTFYPVAWGGIVEKGVGYGSSFRIVLLRNGKLRASIGNEHITVDSPDKVALNAWVKVKASFDGRTLKLMIDDKPVAQAPAAPRSLASESPIEIGRRFTGKIDDVRIVY